MSTIAPLPTPELLVRMTGLGAHLVALVSTAKRPVSDGWPLARALSVEDAETHLDRGGNVGVNLAASAMICLDAENFAATAAVTGAGFTHTVIPAKSQTEHAIDPAKDKRGGTHTWLRVPDGIDPWELRSDRTGITLPGGGVIDVLAGHRQAVAPPSQLAEAPGYMYQPALGGPLDPSSGVADIAVAPMWLFDPQVPGCPPELAPLNGILAAKTAYDRVEADAKSQELTDRIDEISWDTWIAGDQRLQQTGQLDTCGCEIYHWHTSENGKSVTLHDGCDKGYGAHVWSGTMIGELGLNNDHLSRLNFAALLRGVKPRDAAASVGITLGGSSGEDLAPVRPEHFEQAALDAARRGDETVAAKFREAAATMRGLMPADIDAGEIGENSRIAGRVPTPPQRPNPPSPDASPRPALMLVPPIGTIGVSGTAALKPPPITAAADAGPFAGLRSGAWLDNQIFAPLEYHVPGIVAEGCGIIAGPPKVGKSWWVLSVALAIASGGTALGCLPCTQRPVLYLALEDGHRRLQARARQLLGPGIPIPAGLNYMLEIPEGATAVSLVTEWLALHPGERPFVVVDTLGKTRGAGPARGSNAYQEDYKAVGDLKHAIDAVPGAGMLLVHHTRKSEAGRGGTARDFVEALSGTFGLSGAADYAMVLDRDRNSEEGALAVTGRDVIERSVAMTRDPETGRWTLDGGSIEAAVEALFARYNDDGTDKLGDVSQRIIAAVAAGCPKPGDTMSPDEIAAAMGVTAVSISRNLARLADSNRLDRPQRGRYAPITVTRSPGAAPPPLPI